MIWVWLGLLVACAPDTEVVAFQRELKTSVATFDAGLVAIGDRETLTIYVGSTATGDVTVFDATVDDEEHWEVRPEWKLADTDWGDTDDEQLVIPGGTEDYPTYAPIEVVFKPDAEEQFRTVLTIISNDTEVTERVEGDESRGVWKVVLRGIGRYPCAVVYPQFMDFGTKPANGHFRQAGTIENCGVVTLTVADFDFEGSPSFYITTKTPVFVLPRSSEQFEVAFEPDGGAPPETTIITPETNDPYFQTTIEVVGNDADATAAAGVDEDGDGFLVAAGDCDDNNPDIYPGAEEISNELDDDCDGLVDEGSYSFDDDDDGYAEIESGAGDCDDGDPWSFPGADEDCDGTDNDCDGVIDEDADGVEDGACAFIVGRKVTPSQKGCASAPARPAWWPWALLLGWLAPRRRRDQATRTTGSDASRS